MKTGKTTIEIDGENYSFYFEKSGGNKGAGITGEEDDKLYQSGMLLEAGSDEKYVVVKKTTYYETDTVEGKEVRGKKDYETYVKLEDAEDFMREVNADTNDGLEIDEADFSQTEITVGHVTKKTDNFKEAYNVVETENFKENPEVAVEYILINTSGKIIDNKSKNKDGNDYYYVVAKGGTIQGLYVED